MRRFCLPLAAVAIGGCGLDQLGPILRVRVDPAVMCESVEQEVLLEAETTTDAPPVRFEWTLAPEPLRFERGSLTEERLRVVYPGERPLEILLEVTDADDNLTPRRLRVPLVRTALRPCTAGCAASESCETVAGEPQCVLQRDCIDDDDCGCLRCQRTDEGLRRCLP